MNFCIRWVQQTIMIVQASKQPLFPDGYAIPQQLPVLPQRYAEIMAGRIPHY